MIRVENISTHFMKVLYNNLKAPFFMSKIETCHTVTVKGKYEDTYTELIDMGYGMYRIYDKCGRDLGVYITPEGHDLIRRLLGSNWQF